MLHRLHRIAFLDFDMRQRAQRFGVLRCQCNQLLQRSARRRTIAVHVIRRPQGAICGSADSRGAVARGSLLEMLHRLRFVAALHIQITDPHMHLRRRRGLKQAFKRLRLGQPRLHGAA